LSATVTKLAISQL